MFTSVILAAGMGTRMKSKMPKVLHKVCGKPLSKWVIDASKAAGADKVCAVVGHKAETVKEVLGDVCEFALQAEQKGTGHAVMQAIDVIKNSKGEVVILNGDTPLITAETINKAIEYHKNNGNQATVITAILDDATGYGRIVRDNDGSVLKIVEQKDASEEEKKINEVNSGMYVFDAQSLVYALDKITPNNAQGEYYLTDTLEILLSAGKKIGGYAISDNDEIRGINDRVQLNEAEKIMQKRINEYHMRNGVTMRNPESVYIEDGVEMVKDGAQNLYERAKPTIDKTIDNIMEHTKDAPAEPDVRDEISREVDEQLNKIHQSTVAPTPFSEYIRETYGKKKD